jgi:hypothetical protein
VACFVAGGRQGHSRRRDASRCVRSIRPFESRLESTVGDARRVSQRVSGLDSPEHVLRQVDAEVGTLRAVRLRPLSACRRQDGAGPKPATRTTSPSPIWSPAAIITLGEPLQRGTTAPVCVAQQNSPTDSTWPVALDCRRPIYFESVLPNQAETANRCKLPPKTSKTRSH